MRKTALILFVATLLSGCVSTYEQMQLAIGKDTGYLVRTMGFPDRKEEFEDKTVWVYEEVTTSQFPDRTVKTVVSKNEKGYPTRTESVTYKGSAYTRLRYRHYFVDSENIIVDVDYGSRTIQSSY